MFNRDYSRCAGKTPKVGYYFILRIYKYPPMWNPQIEEWIADAYYKETWDSPFSNNFVQIRLKPLFNRYSTKCYNYNYDNCSEMLLNSVIIILNVEKFVDIDHGYYTSVIIYWRPFKEYEEGELLKMFPTYYKMRALYKPKPIDYGTLEDDLIDQ